MRYVDKDDDTKLNNVYPTKAKDRVLKKDKSKGTQSKSHVDILGESPNYSE